MYIDIVPNRKSRPAALLREAHRDGKKIVKRTLANLSALPMDQIEAIREVLKGKKMTSVDQMFQVVSSSHHGHVKAVLRTMQKLKLDKLLSSTACREQRLVMGMVAARLLEPDSKLAMTRWWHNTTLAQELDISDATEKDLYGALDWLLKRQSWIEKKLAKRHLEEEGLVLYDLTSSYVEGKHCPLARFGYSRDKKRGKLQVNYGLLTDEVGRPVSVSVYQGNTGDSKTLLPQVEKVKKEFGIKRMVLVGDRGMIQAKQIETLRQMEGVEWLTALRTQEIRALAEGGALQMGLFDERNLFEIRHPELYPGERLVACRNPELAMHRKKRRQELLEATEKELAKVERMVYRGKLKEKEEIGLRVGKVINKYKVGKHFVLEIDYRSFSYTIDEKKVAKEAALDGIYVVRTSVSKDRMDTNEVVLTYKQLSQVEQAFRSLKGVDLLVRPIRHWLEDRVRAHILLSMLAYYVQWHMKEAWRPLLFSDEEWEQNLYREDPVSSARRSKEAKIKARTKKRVDGGMVHSFKTLLSSLSTIVRNQCRREGSGETTPTFGMDTQPNEDQQIAYDLLDQIECCQ